MGKAKKFKGIKVRFVFDDKDFPSSTQNVLYNSVDEFYERQKYDHPLLDYRKKTVELAEDNLTLYEVISCKPEGDANILINFRNCLKSPNCYRHSRYLTIEEIDEAMKEGYVIAVRGLNEIDSTEELV